MKELQELFMIFGVLSTWYLFGVAVMKTIVYRDEYWHGDRVVTYAFAIGWPVLGLITLLHRIGRQTFPWIKRKWKAFRAPKVEKKKEKAATKIRMCPALKLKKYEQLLTEIETMHNRHYYHYIHNPVTEFARIKGGKPEVKEQAMAFNQAIAPIGGWVEVNDWDAVPAEGQEVQAVRWDVVVPMPEPERNENW